MSTQYQYHPHILQLQSESEQKFLNQFESEHHSLEDPMIILNPYLIAPLTALIAFHLPEPASVTLLIKGKSDDGNQSFSFPASSTHFIPIYGLYPGYKNEVVLTLDNGKSVTHDIKTEAAPSSINRPEYVRTSPTYFGDHVMFVSPSSFSKMAAFDYKGDLRWYCTLNVVFDIKRVSNGRIWIATERLVSLPYMVTGIYEMSMIGKIYKEYRIPGGIHHDYVEDKNGDIFILTQDPSRDTVEDMCDLIDRTTGDVTKSYDFKPLLPASAAGGNRVNVRDWVHTNAVWYDEKSHSLSFSGRNLDAIFNLDIDTGKLNWILGDPNKWPKEMVEAYFFKPDTDDDDFEWFYAQHSVQLLNDNDVLLLDNGAWRSKYADQDIAPENKYSRGVRYTLNHDDKTVRQVWQYGKARGWAFFSPHISNVIHYGGDHYLVHSGDIGQIKGIPCDKPPIFYLGKPEEKDLTYYAITTEILNGELVYEMKIPSNAYYRARKLKLYHEGDRLVFGAGKQLGGLGKTKTLRQKELSGHYGSVKENIQPRIDDEIDRFRFTVSLESGTYAQLILKNEKEQHTYHLPTTEKDPLTMCVGTFQSQAENDFFITISKEGLQGTYAFYLRIEEEIFDLAFSLNMNEPKKELKP